MPRKAKEAAEYPTEKTKVDVEKQQPEVNIGLFGHIDNGKTSLTEALTGKFTDTHSEEIKRGITIRLGYADAIFYKCARCKPDYYTTKKQCDVCKSQTVPLRKVSFIDAPGHESLMATMLSGAAIIDGAMLVIAANEECPQPQTKEHLMALQIIGQKNIVIVQNKIDVVSKEDALKNYQQIRSFVKGTIAEEAPIIPVSALHKININYLIHALGDRIKTPERNTKLDPLLFVARSFDINRPGTDINNLCGGVLGGALKQGVLKVNDEIEIRPGLTVEKGGKKTYQPVITEVVGLKTGGISVNEVRPGGSIGVLTRLDPFYVKADSFTGNVVGLKGKLPQVWHEFDLRPMLLERLVGIKEELKVEPIKKLEPLMLNVNSAATVGVVTELKKNVAHVRLKIPVCCYKEDRLTVSRMIGNRWHLIGTAEIVAEK